VASSDVEQWIVRDRVAVFSPKENVMGKNLPWSSSAFFPLRAGGGDGCDHDDYSSGSNADSPSNDDGGAAEGDGDGGR